MILCRIDDDSIGRTNASENKINKLNKSSLALNISNERIAWLQKDAGLRADFEITDKFEGDNAAGTKVALTLLLIIKVE